MQIGNHIQRGRLDQIHNNKILYLNFGVAAKVAGPHDLRCGNPHDNVPPQLDTNLPLPTKASFCRNTQATNKDTQATNLTVVDRSRWVMEMAAKIVGLDHGGC